MFRKKVRKSREIKSIFLRQLLLLNSKIILRKKVKKLKKIESIFLR